MGTPTIPIQQHIHQMKKALTALALAALALSPLPLLALEYEPEPFNWYQGQVYDPIGKSLWDNAQFVLEDDLYDLRYYIYADLTIVKIIELDGYYYTETVGKLNEAIAVPYWGNKTYLRSDGNLLKVFNGETYIIASSR